MPTILDAHARTLIIQRLAGGELELTYGREEGNVIYLTAKPTLIGRAHKIASEIAFSVTNGDR